MPFHVVMRLLIAACLAGSCAGAELEAWHESLEVAIQQAAAREQLVLLRANGEACPWCRKFDEEIAKPDVQAALSDWTLCVLNVDASSELAFQFQIIGVPALRVLSSRGVVLASHDGYMEAQELIAWLDECKSGKPPVDAALLAKGPPSLLEVMRITRHFEARDPTLREAAIARLRPYPKQAGNAVVQILREDSLAAKLSAHEMLTAWRADVTGLDPWRAETLDEAAIQRLEAWVEQLDPGQWTNAQQELSEDERQQLQRELEELLSAQSLDVVAVRERIARRGSVIRQEVLQRLKNADSDRDRERLRALRYRLAASDSLEVEWPDGIRRLADTDAAVRREAARDLAGFATVDHQPLLLELFSDPDAAVRETSLRGLRNLGGADAKNALVALLEDPEPNVRAAVLKQLAEDASRGMVESISSYVRVEQDADLLVHAVRYLRAANDTRAVPALLGLLKHTSWQVRAEAAEALGVLLDSGYGSGWRDEELSDEQAQQMVEIYDALLAALSDADPFVVSRSLEGLSQVNTIRAVEPLTRAAKEHPQLAAEIVQILAQGTAMREAAIPELRTFLKHESGAVRAAALSGLCKASEEYPSDDVIQGVKDPDASVRIAASQLVLQLLTELESERISEDLAAVESTSPASAIVRALGGLFFGNRDGKPSEDQNGGDQQPDEPSDDDETTGDNAEVGNLAHETWLAELKEGQHRPKWTTELVEPLRMMLAGESADERLAAALVLVPLGEESSALPVIRDVVTKSPWMIGTANQVLAWLSWNERVTLFREMNALATDDDSRMRLINGMNHIVDARTADLYWELLEQPNLNTTSLSMLEVGLARVYFGSEYFNATDIGPAKRRRITAELKAQISEGEPHKRIVAANLLTAVAPDEVASSLETFVEDQSVDQSWRQDAFVLMVAAQTDARRAQMAIDALRGDEALQPSALGILAVGPSSLTELPRSKLQVRAQDILYGSYQLRSRDEIPSLAPPRGLKVADIEPYSGSEDPVVAAQAGYLLTLFGDKSGLEPVLALWRTRRDDPAVMRLTYRAIAAVNETAQMPVLREIYGELSEYEVSEFYWTIRSMTGPEILRFRKEIRDKVGMTTLR